RFENKLVRQAEPIFQNPDNSKFIGIRAHFYAPTKYFFGKNIDTFWFNMMIIWMMSILLYPPLYYEHFKKILKALGDIKIPKLFKKK
ncbi:MAG: hypothetical protein U9Q83_06785, partial [Bacteroidota bacterium]|nr:hypothetical protein [Bacteroidota bacterium]